MFTKNFLRVLGAALSLSLSFQTQAQPINSVKNTPFPLVKIDSKIASNADLKIVVFMPTISDETEYTSMLVQAFKYYFIRKQAFAPDVRDKAKIDIILLSNKDTPVQNKEIQTIVDKGAEEAKASFSFLDKKIVDQIRSDIYSNLYDTSGMKVYKQIPKKLSSLLSLPDLSDANADSVLFLLDKNNRIILRDDHYRAQGEHLKPLEHAVKAQLNLPFPKNITTKEKTLAIGDNAPDITLMDGKKLSDYKGSVVVLGFYPAPFSGTFDAGLMVKKEVGRMERSMMSCMGEIRSLYRAIGSAPTPDSVVFFAISESTPDLLTSWRGAFEQQGNIGYVNDEDYQIAEAFNAIKSTPSGTYHDRTTVIVDQQGKIAYLNKDYQYQDEQKVQNKVKELLEK